MLVDKFRASLGALLLSHPIDAAGDGRCPSNYPYPYNNGQDCCATETENTDPQGDDKCDGSTLAIDSVCCENDNFLACPSDRPCAQYLPRSAEPTKWYSSALYPQYTFVNPYHYRNKPGMELMCEEIGLRLAMPTTASEQENLWRAFLDTDIGFGTRRFLVGGQRSDNDSPVWDTVDGRSVNPANEDWFQWDNINQPVNNLHCLVLSKARDPNPPYNNEHSDYLWKYWNHSCVGVNNGIAACETITNQPPPPSPDTQGPADTPSNGQATSPVQSPATNCLSNCWNDDGSGNCVLSDSAECQSTVTCSPFEMDIKLPSDMFGDNFEFDGDQGCHPTLQNEEYVYNRPLGNCGVELSRGQNANGDDIITFKKDITAIVPDAAQSSQTVDGITFFTNIAANSYTVSFSCSFPATFSTSSASVAVAVDEADLGDVGVTVTAPTDETPTWDGSFELEFFTSDTFLTKREQTCPATFPHSYLNGEKCCSVTTSDCSDGESFDCPENACSNFDDVNGGIIVGQEQFIQTTLNIPGLENKLRYYIDECFVTDGGAGTSLHIIKDSCYAGIIGAQALGSASSQSKVVQSTSQFKFTAFTFDARSKANSQTLTCSLKFCIWDEANSSSDCDVAEVDGSGNGVCPTDAGYDFEHRNFLIKV